jgi:hypothetical protein
LADLNDQTANISIHDETSDAAVTTTIDGSKIRLDVDTAAESNPTLYTLEFDEDSTGSTVTSASDVDLVSVTGSGLIDFIRVASGSSGYEIALEIDSVERVRLTMAEIGNDFALSNATNVQIWVDTANKNFGFNPSEGVGYSTNFKVIAKATGSDVTLKHLVQYRELS